jgi:hypothetical protein
VDVAGCNVLAQMVGAAHAWEGENVVAAFFCELRIMSG